VIFCNIDRVVSSVNVQLGAKFVAVNDYSILADPLAAIAPPRVAAKTATGRSGAVKVG
jgi:predicted metallo-beta-lactamase superfamily hydrolase